jgi:hypothetical protein
MTKPKPSWNSVSSSSNDFAKHEVRRFGRPVGDEDDVFFRAIKKAGYPGLPYSKGDARSCSAIYTLSPDLCYGTL